jgi:hypothetical protein
MSNRIKRGVRRQRQNVRCGMPIRGGIDLHILAFLKDVDKAFRAMRADIAPSPGDDIEVECVRRYLAYLSMLVDVALAGLTMNALHQNDLLVVMLQRLLVEYAAKGLYYQAHPRFAVFMMRINEADSVVQRVKDGNLAPERIAEAETHAKEMRATYPDYATIPGVTVRQMMEDVARTEDWAWLYGAPSVLIHGEPEGMRTLYDFSQGGRARIDLDDSYLNALLVDGGMNTLTFCRAFNSAFHADEPALLERFEALERRAEVLIAKHSDGRDADELPVRSDQPQ